VTGNTGRSLLSVLFLAFYDNENAPQKIFFFKLQSIAIAHIGLHNMGGEYPDDYFVLWGAYHIYRLRRAVDFYNLLYADEVLSSDDEPLQAQPLSVDLSPPPRELIRSHPPNQRVMHAGGKRPRPPLHGWRDLHGPDMESDSDDEGSQVDLEVYFHDHNVTPKRQVLICRSYASYVAARLKEKKRLKIKELKP